MSAERVRNLIPFVHVTDVARSIAFYELLGFELEDTYEHDGHLDWAALENRDAQLMLAHASAPSRDLADGDARQFVGVEVEDAVAVSMGRAYDPSRAGPTLTRRQIPASVPAHARPCASPASPVF